MSATTTGARQRRVRFSGGLPDPGSGSQPYAQCREELRDFTPGKITALIINSDAWSDVMKPILAELEGERRKPGKEQPFYRCEELEAVLVYQCVAGLQTYREARRRLAGDDAEARGVLGLTFARMGTRRPNRVLKHFDGIPSEATISRHKRRFGLERRRDAICALEERFLAEHLDTPELQEEARVLHLDGSTILTHYTAPRFDAKTKKQVNRPVTAPDAGYMARGAGPDKSGDGWTLISLVSGTGVPLVPSTIVKINEPECAAAEKMIATHYDRLVRSRLGDDQQLAVLSADSGFHKQTFRKQLRSLGVLENVHPVSHSYSDKSLRNARKNNAFTHEIRGYPNWRANGHREIACRCGEGRTSKRTRLQNGRAVARMEGHCATCGSITITSGEWVTKQSGQAGAPFYFARRDPRRKDEQVDFLFGNPLTFNSREAAIYGRDRFGRHEGFHGMLEARFGLLKKRWFRHQAQAETEAALVFSIIHAVSLEQRRQRRLAAQPPPSALAA